jgi:predicted metal-binding protein
MRCTRKKESSMSANPAPPITEIIVCTTCRPAGSGREGPAQGQALLAAVADVLETHGAQGLQLRAQACMSGCARACTVAFQAAGKYSYYFGDLAPDGETAAQVVACAGLHRGSADGNLPRSGRPERLRGGILMRLPPLGQA